MRSFMDVQTCHFGELTTHFAQVKLRKVVRPPLELKQGLEMSIIASVIRSPAAALQVEVGRVQGNKHTLVRLDLELRVPHLRGSIMPYRRERSLVSSEGKQ